MFTYVVKRLLAMIPTLVGISMITFLIVYLAPGDPVDTQMGAGGAGKTTEGGGGSDDMDDNANALEAKRKLLGMMEEHYAVLAWDAAHATRAREWKSDDKYADVMPMESADGVGDDGAFGSFGVWARSIALIDDAEAVVGLRDGRVLAVDTSDGTTRRELRTDGEPIGSVAVSNDGTRAAASDTVGIVTAWSLSDGAELWTTPAAGDSVREVAFSPDGRHVVSAGGDGTITVRGAADGTVVSELNGHTRYVTALAFSHDGTRMWSGGADRSLIAWDTDSWTVAEPLADHRQTITDIAVSLDDTRLVTACEDNVLRVFDVGPAAIGRKPVAELGGHYLAATAVALHPDGRTLFSGGADKTIRTWDLVEERQTGQVPVSTGQVHELRLTADGAVLLTAGDSWRKTSIAHQYMQWFKRLATGDLGRSFIDREPVIDKLKKALPVTLGLNLLAFIIIYTVSIPLGVMAAVKRGGVFDTVSSLIVFLLWSMPSFWLATLLITYLSSERTWNLLPSVGLHDTNAADMPYLAWLSDWGRHLVLPVLVLVYGGFASLSRYARSSLLETIAHDYIRTARAKGLSERVVIFKHALRNSLIAVITLAGSMLPAMIGGSVIVEFIFTIRGMGLLAFNAILQRDYPVIMAVTTMSAALTLVGVLVSDLLYGVADPRISHE